MPTFPTTATVRSWMKQHRIALILIVIALTALGGYFYNRSKQKQLEGVESTTVRRGTLTQELTLSGEIVSKEYAQVAFQTGGKLSHLAVKEGDVVRKGQYLASLDQRQLQKTLQKRLNDFMTSRLDFDQKRDNYDEIVPNDTIKRILDTSQLSLNNSILDVELQSISKELSVLTSPIQGIVTSTYKLQPGVNIALATPIVEIVNPDTLYFKVTADQTEVTEISQGLAGTLLLDAFLDEDIPGTITHIAFTPSKGESSTVYDVDFSFTLSSNAQLKYRSGMTGDVTFVTEEKKNALYIPFKYITEKDGASFVTVDENGTKAQREIKTGIETDVYVEVVSGLSEGETIFN